MLLPTFEAGLKDTLEVEAIVIATQPQLLVYVSLSQEGGGCRRGRAQVFRMVKELRIGALPLVHLPCQGE